jgi:hypothetical protein
MESKESLIKELEEKIEKLEEEIENYKVVTFGGVLLTILTFGIGIFYVVYRIFQKRDKQERLQRLEDRLYRIKEKRCLIFEEKRVSSS